MKKPFKIVKSDLVKEQEKLLPPDVKKAFDKKMMEITKDPYNVSGSMPLFGKPSAEELFQWCSGDELLNPEQVDLVLEYLRDKNCLSKIGKKLAEEFWEKYIKTITEDTKIK